jgi:hypothetical protein
LTGDVSFIGFSTGRVAQLNTDAGGTVDFSGSSGPANNNQLTVGSIAGAGTYLLGADQLTVGLEGISTNVSGLISGSGGAAMWRRGNDEVWRRGRAIDEQQGPAWLVSTP